MKFSYTLPILSLLGSVFADDSFYTTMTPAEAPIGDTNPTGTYGIKLLTMDSNKMLAKRGLDKRYCGTTTNVYDVTKTSAGRRVVVPTTETVPYCVLKRDNIGPHCYETIYQTTTSSCPIWTMTFTNQYMVPPGETGALVTATYTDTVNCQATPTSVTRTVCSPDKRDTGYGVLAQLGGSAYDDDGSLTGACVSPHFHFSNGLLYDPSGEVGFIASNGQFMFAGPPPQAGTLYAAGWSLTDDYFLALGFQTSFWACQADGANYKVFNSKIYESCQEVMAKVYTITC
ncbi:unnamed protein product [Ambrosiozyma monospora]|uniref:Unnamed protein product n=1 Tax=Ambrosiozyma monospora TaxID=43982 RepID=A0ACB5SSF8_AMBMO|nr:unnamed protein product [Ambrosiozyma monospora]